jgi:hypothetical protein
MWLVGLFGKLSLVNYANNPRLPGAYHCAPFSRRHIQHRVQENGVRWAPTGLHCDKREYQKRVNELMSTWLLI